MGIKLSKETAFRNCIILSAALLAPLLRDHLRQHLLRFGLVAVERAVEEGGEYAVGI